MNGMLDRLIAYLRYLGTGGTCSQGESLFCSLDISFSRSLAFSLQKSGTLIISTFFFLPFSISSSSFIIIIFFFLKKKEKQHVGIIFLVYLHTYIELPQKIIHGVPPKKEKKRIDVSRWIDPSISSIHQSIDQRKIALNPEHPAEINE